MLTTEYANAYSEVLEILKYISTEDFNKIPISIVEMFKANATDEKKFVYHPNKTLEEQNVSELARTIIAILFRDYWTTEVQKEKILAKQNYEREKLKEEMYNPDNLFKNKQPKIEKNIKEEQLTIYKESILKRIFNKILVFFHFK